MTLPPGRAKLATRPPRTGSGAIAKTMGITGPGLAPSIANRRISQCIWMNPDLLQARGLTPQDVIAAIQQQSQDEQGGLDSKHARPRTQIR